MNRTEPSALNQFHIRPTFSIDLDRTESDPVQAIRCAIEHDPEINGQFRRGHAMLCIRPERRHFWSPWLHLDVRERDDRVILHGRFSPHPTIWTAYVFAYGTLAVLFSFASIFAASQYLTQSWPSAALALPVCIAMAIILWITAQVGQRLARDEMQMMAAKVHDSLGSLRHSRQSSPASQSELER